MFVGKEGTAAALTLIDVEAEIDSCYFSANQLGTFKDSVKTLNLVISDVIYIVVRNASSSVHVGGAMFISHSNATIIHTVFRNNSAEIGGDIFNTQESNVSIISCSFYDGGGSVFGGAIFMEDSSVTMEECQVISKQQLLEEVWHLLYPALPFIIQTSHQILATIMGELSSSMTVKLKYILAHLITFSIIVHFL